MKLAKKVFVTLFCLLFVSIPWSSLHAKSPEDMELAAVVSVINSYLLDSPLIREVSLEPSQFLQGPYIFGEDFTINFNRPDTDIYLCFFLQGLRGMQDQEVAVELNGVSRSVRNGENCYLLTSGSLLDQNTFSFTILSAGLSLRLRQLGIEASRQYSLGMRSFTRANWNALSVRKVLRVFAFGGHAKESQISAWASMRPKVAIRQMLNFSKHNLRLSPLAIGEKYTEPARAYGTLQEFSNLYLGSTNSNLPIPVGQRDRFRVDAANNDNSLGDSLFRMITTRGLNPFRHRIGLWETNYHLAVNLAKAAVTRNQVAIMYDEIMDAHERNLPYQEVLATAAKSAAVAAQYGHFRNSWVADECQCNEDFAREWHQLYFGIFGEDDPDYHENISIPNTAKALTGMPLTDNGNTIGFTAEKHHIGSLTILGSTISGANASEKIDNLARVSISHPESQHNLPVMIIAGLADDNLTETKKSILRAAWRAMGDQPSFLDFIQAYAISYIFHEDSLEQFKYFSSFERAIYMANRYNLENIESLTAGRSNSLSGNLNRGYAGFNPSGIFRNDNAILFYPSHNVFGGQTSLEAVNSSKVLEHNLNRSTEFLELFANYAECQECDLGGPWKKDWSSVIPKNGEEYSVGNVAKWLWTYIVGHTADYGALERAYLLSILGAVSDEVGTYRVFDFAQLLCIRQERILAGVTNNALSDLVSRSAWENYCAFDNGYSSSELDSLNRVFSEQDFTSDVNRLLNQIAVVELALDSEDPVLRLRANQRVQQAIAFIFSTPYVFAQEAVQ